MHVFCDEDVIRGIPWRDTLCIPFVVLSATRTQAPFHSFLTTNLPSTRSSPPLSPIPFPAIATKTVDTSTGAPLSTSALVPPSPGHPVHGPPATIKASFPAASKPDPKGHPSPLTLLVWSDHMLSLERGGNIIWSREEALAGVVSTVFIDLPAAKGAGAGEGVGVGRAAGGGGSGGLIPDGMKAWWRMQALAVLVQFKMGTEDDKTELMRLRGELR